MSDYVMVCAWCKKIKNKKGVWEDKKMAHERDLRDEKNLSHGICDVCVKKLEDEQE